MSGLDMKATDFINGNELSGLVGKKCAIEFKGENRLDGPWFLVLAVSYPLIKIKDGNEEKWVNLSQISEISHIH